MYNDVTEWVTAYVMKGTEVMTIKTRKVCNQWRGFNPLGNQDQPPLTLYWNGKQQFDHGLSFLFHKNKYFTKDIMLQTWILTGSLHTLHFSSFCWSAHYRKKKKFSLKSAHIFVSLTRIHWTNSKYRPLGPETCILPLSTISGDIRGGPRIRPPGTDTAGWVTPRLFCQGHSKSNSLVSHLWNQHNTRC